VSFPPLVALRSVLFLGTFLPVLVLTWIVAQQGFAMLTPAGPDAGSVFMRMGWVPSNVIPLAVLAIALVGHALRERSPEFAFASGILTLATLVGGYALGKVISQGTLAIRNSVEMLQLATLTAGAWAYLWLLSRRWVDAWTERSDSPAGPSADVTADCARRPWQPGDSSRRADLAAGGPPSPSPDEPAHQRTASFPLDAHCWNLARLGGFRGERPAVVPRSKA